MSISDDLRRFDFFALFFGGGKLLTPDHTPTINADIKENSFRKGSCTLPQTLGEI